MTPLFTFQGCQMQLTDEPDKRCYPLDDHLFCRTCHIKELGGMQPNSEVGNIAPAKDPHVVFFSLQKAQISSDYMSF